MNDQFDAFADSVGLDDLLAARDAFKAEIEAAYAHIDHARALHDATPFERGAGMYRTGFDALPRFRFHSAKQDDIYTAEKFVKGYDARAWQHLMQASGLTAYMSKEALEAWDQSVYEKTTPAFERALVVSRFDDLFLNRHAMLDSSVLSIYRRLSWNPLINQPTLLGSKIVLYGRVDTDVSIDTARTIDDLVGYMHVADERSQPDPRSAFMRFAHRPPISADGHEDDYIRVAGYRSGSLHVFFKRVDLIDRMNHAVAAAFPKAEPPPTRWNK